MEKVIQQLNDELSSYQLIAGMVADILFEYDHETKKMMNRVGTGHGFGEPHFSDNPREVCKQMIYPADHHLMDHMFSEIQKGKPHFSIELRMKRQDGEYHWALFEGTTVRDENGKLKKTVGRIKELNNPKTKASDVVDEKDADHNTNMRDPLTKLLNWKSCEKVLKDYISEHENQAISLLILDLDDFSTVNQRLGHSFGDEVLCSVSETLKAVVPKSDVLARIGGDSFLVGFLGLKSRTEAQVMTEMVREAISTVYIGEKSNGSLSVTMGAAVYPVDGNDFKTVFERASMSVLYGKKHHKGDICYWGDITQENPERVHAIDRKSSEQRIRDHRDYVNSEGIDRFGYELTEVAFQMMDEMKDVESTIQLLLRKVADHYDLSAIYIREATDEPYTIEDTYAYLRKDYGEFEKGKVHKVDVNRWDNWRKTYKDGYFYYNMKENEKVHSVKARSSKIPLQSLLEIPMLKNGHMIGCMDFYDAYVDRKWADSEIRTLKNFGQIIKDFLLNMREYREATEELAHMRELDQLTGFYLYDVFLKKLQKEIDIADYSKEKLVIVYSDIRHFRYINEHYGMDTGNRLLKMFADELERNKPAMLFGTRVFSDNIVALVKFDSSIDDNMVAYSVRYSNEEFTKKARKEFLNSKLNINTGIYIVQPGDQAERSVSNANLARKISKEPGNSGVVIKFSESMADEIKRQVQLTDLLPTAIKDHELMVYYQPKIESRTGMLIGAEALVRWRRPNGKFMYPDEFIPVYERNGSIVELDYFVYREVFIWLKKRLDAGLPVVPISVNVSRFHMRDDAFLEYIRSLYEEFRIPYHLVEFELTEGLYVENMEHAHTVTSELRRMGAKVSMDDFGSGFSSLNVLNNLPIDVLKLDKVFMKHDILQDGDKAILQSVINMAKSLHISVLCEGVENQDQDAYLRHIGCDIIQGYFYGKPMPEEDFENMVQRYFRTTPTHVAFTFNNTLADTTGKYKVEEVGGKLSFCGGPRFGVGGIRFKGDSGAEGKVLSVPLDILHRDEYTITFWAKEAEVRANTPLMYMECEDGYRSLMLHERNNCVVVRSRCVDQEIWYNAGGSYEPDSEWHFYAMVKISTKQTLQLFIDGKPEGYCHPLPEFHNIRKFQFGGGPYGEGFKGSISDLKLFRGSLNSLEINELYREGKEII